jgi:hypothetical protein
MAARDKSALLLQELDNFPKVIIETLVGNLVEK